MNTSIPWEWYRTFLAVLQEGSLSGASRTLNITQPTAGRHIAGLETALGQALFTRSQTGLLATDACYNDVNGYQVQNDYWLDGTQPTQQCNMHQSITLCTESKRRPTEYCPNVATYSRVYIPEGHPLRQADKDVVSEYLTGVTADPDASSIGRCRIHTEEWYNSQHSQPDTTPDDQPDEDWDDDDDDEDDDDEAVG